jgi:hypothetical protein
VKIFEVSARRVTLAILLPSLFLMSVGWIFLDWPIPFETITQKLHDGLLRRGKMVPEWLPKYEPSLAFALAAVCTAIALLQHVIRPKKTNASEIHENVLVACYWSWFLGILFMLQGIQWDMTGFWSNQPFLVNVFSTVTVAFFGVPIAVLFTQKLMNAQDLVEKRYNVGTMAIRIMGHLLDGFYMLCPKGRPPELSLMSGRGEFLLEKFALYDQSISSFEEFRDHVFKLSQVLPERAKVENGLQRITEAIGDLSTLRSRFDDVDFGLLKLQLPIDHSRILSDVKRSLDEFYSSIEIAEELISAVSIDGKFEKVVIADIYTNFESHMSRLDALVRGWCDFLLKIEEMADSLQQLVRAGRRI